MEADLRTLQLQNDDLICDLLAFAVVTCRVLHVRALKPSSPVQYRTLSATVLNNGLKQSNLLVNAADATVRPPFEAVLPANFLEHRRADVCGMSSELRT